MLPLKVAVRFLTYSKIQTILIIAAISIAVAIQLYVGIIIDSLQRTIVQRTLGNSPHIMITSATEVLTIRDFSYIIRRLQEFSQINNISTSVSGSGFAGKKNKIDPIIIKGFNFEDADRIYHLNNAIFAGKPYTNGNEAIIGKDLAADLNISIGDDLTITISENIKSTYRVTGLYDLGVANINRSWVITSFEATQRLFDYGNRATAIDVTVRDIFSADVVASQIKQSLNNKDIKVEDWKSQNRELLSGLTGQQISGLLIQVFIIISVVIAISSVLAITVFQKSRQVGILKAMGITDFAASLIFVYEGLLLGLNGTVFGVGLGLGITLAFEYFTKPVNGPPPVDLYLDYAFVLRSWLISLAAASFSGIIPARRSLKVNPVEVIREA